MSARKLQLQLLIASAAMSANSCSAATELGPTVNFCMQWVNTSNRAVQFHAVDDIGDTLSVEALMVPNIGDAFASLKLHLIGASPISFSASGFGTVTFRPSGGSKVLIVEAHTVNAPLEHYEDNGTCP